MHGNYYTAEARYEVTVDGLASISGYCSTKSSAFKNAVRLFGVAKTEHFVENPVVTVFDRMAHKGKPELWQVVNNELVVKSVR